MSLIIDRIDFKLEMAEIKALKDGHFLEPHQIAHKGDEPFKPQRFSRINLNNAKTLWVIASSSVEKSLE